MTFRNPMDPRAMLIIPINARALSGAKPLSDRMQKLTRDRMIVALSQLASGWNEAVESALRIPEGDVYFKLGRSGAPYTLYSQGETFAGLQVLRALRDDDPFPKQLPEHAFVVDGRYEPTTYLLLVDSSRRIIVYAQLKTPHATPDSEWGDFARTVEEAAKLARQTTKTVIHRNGGVSYL